MEAASQPVIDNLQAACELMAQLAAQYGLDARQFKALGVKWLAKRVKCWHKGSEKFLGQLIDRLLYFGEKPKYDVGSVTIGADTIDGVLAEELDLVGEAHDALVAYRKAAWNAEADYTPDIYEHAIGELEHQAKHIARERALIQKLGEAGYVGARLGDGSDDE